MQDHSIGTVDNKSYEKLKTDKETEIVSVHYGDYCGVNGEISSQHKKARSTAVCFLGLYSPHFYHHASFHAPITCTSTNLYHNYVNLIYC